MKAAIFVIFLIGSALSQDIEDATQDAESVTPPESPEVTNSPVLGTEDLKPVEVPNVPNVSETELPEAKPAQPVEEPSVPESPEEKSDPGLPSQDSKPLDPEVPSVGEKESPPGLDSVNPKYEVPKVPANKYHSSEEHEDDSDSFEHHYHGDYEGYGRFHDQLFKGHKYYNY